MDKVFVYGSLMNISFLDLCFSVMPKKIEDAAIQGMLFDIDTFPVLIEPENPGKDDIVHGLLMTLPELIDKPDIFDSYMDINKKTPPFTREVRTVTRDDGRRFKAWIFVGNPKHASIRKGISEENRVTDGVWIEPVSE